MRARGTAACSVFDPVALGVLPVSICPIRARPVHRHLVPIWALELSGRLDRCRRYGPRGCLRLPLEPAPHASPRNRGLFRLRPRRFRCPARSYLSGSSPPGSYLGVGAVWTPCFFRIVSSFF